MFWENPLSHYKVTDDSKALEYIVSTKLQPEDTATYSNRRNFNPIYINTTQLIR
jgi:hypothetical protein